MDIAIVTGGSKGIGKAIAKKYIAEKYTVFSLARSTTDLKNCTQIKVDLGNLEAAEKSFISLFKRFENKNIHSITLINNAGRLGTISNLENIQPEDIAKTINLNTTIPLILSSLFIKLTSHFKCTKKLINISSGAAIKPYQGWSVYCASKAALNMITQTIASEQNQLKNGVICAAIYPGVVDTEMQEQIRQTNKKDFKNKARFVNLKLNNQLFTPTHVANTLFKIDKNNLVNNGDIIDIRNITD
ncbi:SDR family NAD(P)-dependent oxidoreductase [Tenacibaculum sp. UWU-22]|uniref:SDR family NAD(P)-dependent oxidoreductase n=1 Tax=Tenacibaculum sp. UWU-22 TaxID=3234187 RepID=UPI0034DB50D9